MDKVKEEIGDGVSLDNATKNAVRYRIENNIVKKYLEENAKEVFTMAMLEYDEKRGSRGLEGILYGRR